MARTRTPEEIRQAGLEALVRELGPVDMVRFLQQFETGSGDYSADRLHWLGNQSVQELAEELRQRRRPTKS
jgi:hypothetical protein